MSLYQHYIKEHIHNFRKLNLYSRDTLLIQKKTIQLLKLNDLNELRDKYEGVAYLNKLSLKLYSVIALERYLGINILNIEDLNHGNIELNIIDDDIKISVIPFNFLEIPVIKRYECDPCIMTVFRESRNLYLCGYVSKKDLTDKKNLRKSDSPVWKDRYEYIGFDKLKMFDNLFQLKELYKNDN